MLKPVPFMLKPVAFTLKHYRISRIAGRISSIGMWNPHDSLEPVSQPLVREQPGARGCFRKIHLYHKRFSFQLITKPFREEVF
jgi:hypothetical protein